jgi:GTP-binding protein
MIIHKAAYVISSPKLKDCPKADRPEYAFIGRSNVGKSSLINLLTGMKQLAKISATPGKTQLINHFDIQSKASVNGKMDQWYLVDLPGYGFAKVSASQSKNWEKMIEGYIRGRDSLMNLFVLVDARHTPQEIDLKFVNRLGEWNIPFAIVFTKSDKETQKVVSANVKAFGDALKKWWIELPPIFVTSAQKRTGGKYILDMIQKMNKSYKAAHSKAQA